MIREGGRSILRPYWQLPRRERVSSPPTVPLSDEDRMERQRQETQALAETVRESVRIRCAATCRWGSS